MYTARLLGTRRHKSRVTAQGRNTGWCRAGGEVSPPPASQPGTIAACRRLAKRLSNNISGASAVEFAIVASLFLMVALGILAYGIYLSAAHSVSQLAADSARASIAGLNDTERAKIATDHVTLHAKDFILLDKTKVTVEAAPLADSNQFQVVVRFDASDLPIWFMSGLVPLPPKIIERSASIKRGGY